LGGLENKLEIKMARKRGAYLLPLESLTTAGSAGFCDITCYPIARTPRRLNKINLNGLYLLK
jgi:hypothetical protein